MRKAIYLLVFLLSLSISLNLFQRRNQAVKKVLDKLCEQETDRLRTALAEARVIAQNNQQTNELIARLAPTATPAWLVNSPYTSIYPPTTTPASS